MKRKNAIVKVLLCIAFLLCSCSNNKGSPESAASAPVTDSTESSYTDSSQTDDSLMPETVYHKDRLSEIISETLGIIEQDSSFEIDESTVGKDIADMYDYANRTGCFPVYKGADTEYYPMGEVAFEHILEELEKAEDFIFLEYYTLNEGEMWGKIYDILKRKASEGVEVRVIYDGLINASDLPADFPQQLEQNGIRCLPYSFSGDGKNYDYNIRDHRKIIVIDGKVAFTGGINIADAYINVTHEFGVWKDNLIKIKGNAVNSFTLMFLQMWNSCTDDDKIKEYLTDVSEDTGAEGYIMPFSENPNDEYLVSKGFYMTMLKNARDYVYIITPYLIPDEEFENAIIEAAARGIEVKIYVPGTSDLAVAGTMTRSHYQPLLESGVRLFEYKKGFIHSKVFVSDDTKAIVGTVNIDNRSFVYDFECGVYLYGKSAVAEVLAEFDDNEEDYVEVTLDNIDSFTG